MVKHATDGRPTLWVEMLTVRVERPHLNDTEPKPMKQKIGTFAVLTAALSLGGTIGMACGGRYAPSGSEGTAGPVGSGGTSGSAGSDGAGGSTVGVGGSGGSTGGTGGSGGLTGGVGGSGGLTGGTGGSGGLT